jgi:xanthine dehydrogenase accessory factor
MTFGYRDDKIVFKQLLNKEFYYLGLMGSEAKIATLFKELEEEGISPDKWKHCFIPIGINIYSKTTKEIAVSIAAEIIREKNKNLPTGRTE